MAKHHLELVRAFLEREGWYGLVISGTDPHGSEYLSPGYEIRTWVSGFSGSAGLLVVTTDRAALWTDSRYWLQAEVELSGTGIELMKEGEAETPEIMDWIKPLAPKDSRVGFECWTTPYQLWNKLSAPAKDQGLILVWKDTIFSNLWPDRPRDPGNPVYDYQSMGFSLSRKEKLGRVRSELKGQVHLISSLDDIAWLVNLRGSDIPYNPVFLSYLYLDQDSCELFATRERFDPELLSTLESQGVRVRAYEELVPFLRALPQGTIVALDPARTCLGVFATLENAGITVKKISQPSTLMKARKSVEELKALKEAMVRDGVALVRFHRWWQNHEANPMTEGHVANTLQDFRRTFSEYRGDSFETIPGWRDHGAIVHYGMADSSQGASILGPGLLLLDSGAQYIDGTTDITRVFCRGEPSNEQKKDYTLVLKAHISLAMARFPEGTRGYQLDTLARSVLWNHGLNYGHGTGHGVGHFLCVHEGPARISPNPVDVALKPGMVLSNEPGLYRTGQWGVRLENLVTVVEDEQTPFGRFLKLETLTLAPFEKRLIDPLLLTPDEVLWLNRYHQRVVELLRNNLTEEEAAWLISVCGPV